MNHQKANLQYYEKLSWLIICETMFITLLLLYLTVNFLITSPFRDLFIAIMLWLQLPAIGFIAEYCTRRLDAIKRFCIWFLIIISILIVLAIIILGLIYQTLTTLVASVFFGMALWLMYFPPKKFTKTVNKWKKKK